MKWYRMAAEQGHAGAQCILGISYSDGQSVPQEICLHTFGCRWLQKVMAAGVTTGVHTISSMDYAANAARQLTPEQMMKAQQMIREWEEKHPRK